MQKKNWLRYGFLAVVTAAATSGALIACDGDDTATPAPTTDSGTTTDSSTLPDTGPRPDGGSDAAPVNNPKLIFVHGANQAGPVRLCLVSSPTNANPNPATDAFPTAPLPYRNSAGAIPGPDAGAADLAFIPPGVGSVLPARTVAFQDINFRAVAILPSALLRIGVPGNQKDCNSPEILGGAVYGADASSSDPKKLVENVDFFVLNTVPKGTMKVNKTYVAFATGCPASLAADPKCSNAGPLRVVLKELDATVPAGTQNTMQFVHASSHVDLVTSAMPVKPFVDFDGADAGDGGVTLIDNTGISYAQSAPVANPPTTALPTPAFKLPSAITAAASVGVELPGGARLPQSIAQAAGLSGVAPADIPTFFKAGRGYTFIAVGDPAVPANDPNPLVRLQSAHFLVFDNDPVVPPL
jgi:hypothetical protein